MLASRNGFAQNQDALVRIRDRGVLDGMKAFFSTEMLFLSGGFAGTLNGSFRGIDQNMINTFNELQEFLGIIRRAFGSMVRTVFRWGQD